MALVLSARGYSPIAVGALIALALGAGAVFASFSGTLTHRFGRRATLTGASLLMAVSGALLADGRDAFATIAAFALGTVSAGTQDVGPFAALEQTLIADVAGRNATTIFGRYNLVGAFTIALGASLAAIVPAGLAPWGYAGIGLALAALYASLPKVAVPPAPVRAAGAGPPSRAIEKLAALFAVDAFAGGIVVQSFLAYWFVVRFGSNAHVLGLLFFGANTLGACSLLLAAPLANRIGLVRTMVFTHLPSHVLLIAVPLMPNFESAALALLGRFALSQMDQPTRQALVMAVAAPADRPRAAGLTNAVRPAAAAFGPLISGLALTGAAVGLSFFLSSGLKVAYDLTILAQFHDLDAKLAAD